MSGQPVMSSVDEMRDYTLTVAQKLHHPARLQRAESQKTAIEHALLEPPREVV